jgi:quercetin dioxygenase-like cupin family protein
MKTARIMAVAVLIVGSGLALHVARTQQPRLTRTDLHKAGDVLFLPAGTIHEAKNVGRGNGLGLATYVVGKGKQSPVTDRG